MSHEGEQRDFDELDLPEEGLSPLGGSGETLEAAEGLEEAPEEDESQEKARQGPGLFEKLTKTSPYVVMLGIAALAMIIAALCIVLEWGRYDFRSKPAQTGMAPAAQSAPASTTATA